MLQKDHIHPCKLDSHYKAALPIYYIDLLYRSTYRSVCSTGLVYCRVYEGSSCAVCLGDYENGEMIRQLPDCHHHFHQDCIDQWLATHTTCPMCRRSLLPPDPHAETPVSPPASPTAHLLPLWASNARGRQHQELAVELRPVSCPSSISQLLHDEGKDEDMYQAIVATALQMQAACMKIASWSVGISNHGHV